MDVQHFKAPFLRRTDIWSQADELRQHLLPQAALPVPVLDLAEFDLGLELVPKKGSVLGSVLSIDNFVAGRSVPPVMARKLRVEYKGAIHHVMNQGDRKTHSPGGSGSSAVSGNVGRGL